MCYDKFSDFQIKNKIFKPLYQSSLRLNFALLRFGAQFEMNQYLCFFSVLNENRKKNY